MLSKETFIFARSPPGPDGKTVDLKLDVYVPSANMFEAPPLPASNLAGSSAESKNPGDPPAGPVVVLFFHSGGLVAYDRTVLAPHLVQSCIVRGWILVSADYRLLPQVQGEGLLQDVKAAYDFVRQKLMSRIGMRGTPRVVVAGASAGGFLQFVAGHYMIPKPAAVLSFYSVPTFKHDFFRTGHIFGDEPMKKDEMQPYLDENFFSTGSTSQQESFDIKCLSADGSQNMEYEKPQAIEGEGFPMRGMLYDWFVQENMFPDLVKGVDKGFEDEAWKTFPPTVFILAGADEDVPPSLSEMASVAIGPEKSKVFVAKGKSHLYDLRLFRGDPALAEIEQAWAALDEYLA